MSVTPLFLQHFIFDLQREFFPDVTEEFLEVQLKEVGELERLAEWLYDERNFAALPRRPDNDFTMDEEEEDEEDVSDCWHDFTVL